MEPNEKLINELEAKMHKLLCDLGVKYPDKLTIFPHDKVNGVYVEMYGNGDPIDRIRITVSRKTDGTCEDDYAEFQFETYSGLTGNYPLPVCVAPELFGQRFRDQVNTEKVPLVY